MSFLVGFIRSVPSHYQAKNGPQIWFCTAGVCHVLSIGHIPTYGWDFHNSVLWAAGVGRVVLDILQHYCITEPMASPSVFLEGTPLGRIYGRLSCCFRHGPSSSFSIGSSGLWNQEVALLDFWMIWLIKGLYHPSEMAVSGDRLETPSVTSSVRDISHFSKSFSLNIVIMLCSFFLA